MNETWGVRFVGSLQVLEEIICTKKPAMRVIRFMGFQSMKGVGVKTSATLVFYFVFVYFVFVYFVSASVFSSCFVFNIFVGWIRAR